MPRPRSTLPEPTGPWDSSTAGSFLSSQVIPIRLATSGRNGAMVQSMWFDVHDGAIWCATQADAVIVRRLRADPRVGYEVAGDTQPYRGVRGQAVAEIVEPGAADVLERLIHRYLDDPSSGLARWLRSRATSEVALRLTPVTMHSWDYSARMGP